MSIATKPYKRNDGVIIQDYAPNKDEFYNGNPNVLRAHTEWDFTSEQLIEYARCKKDPIYFVENYCKIISIDDGVIGFKLYDYQRELIKSYFDHRYNISVQSRQSGKTTTTAAFILWFIIFHSEKDCAILANKAAQAREIVQRISNMLEWLPFFLKPGMTAYNKGSLNFDNKSRIISAATSSSSIRGQSVALLYIDEAAFIPNDMEFYESTYPVITSGKKSRVIMTSTPKGARGLFYKLYIEATEQLNEYKHTNIKWDRVPGRDEAWKNETIRNTSPQQFAQEFENSFIGSQGTLIESSYLSQLVFKNPVEQYDNLDIHLPADEERQYVMTVDCAEGVGKDNSAFTVFDVTEIPYKVAAVYRDNNISPILYPTIIYNVATKYNTCPVLVEINSVGMLVANTLFYDLEYEDMLLVSTDTGKQKIGGTKPNLGLKTSVATKAIGCSQLKTLIESGKLEVHDLNIIGELGTFIAKGKSYEADDGCTDDSVATLFIFGWLTTQEYFKDLTDSDVRTNLLNSNNNLIEESLTPFGIINDGTRGQDTYVDSDGTLWVSSDYDSGWMM